MTQFYSRNDVNYSGDVYSIPFKYIHKKEVKVYIDDELWTKWHFLTTNQLTLDEVPEDIGYNNIVSVRRETDIEEKVVTYDNNSLLNKENLNKSQDQLLFAVQEIYDNNTQFAIDIRAEVDEKVERVSDAVEKLEFLEDSVATANEAALEATEQAQIATEKAEETLNTFNEAMTEIDTLRQDSIDEVNQLVADHTDDLNALDQLIKKDADAIINRVSLNMFDTVVKDHVLTYEESKGLALQGTYVYKNAVAGERYGCPDFYAKCLEEYQNSSNEQAYLKSNITQVGTLSDNQGFWSGFSASNYIQIPSVNNTTANTAEFVTKVKITDFHGTYNDIFKPATTNCPFGFNSAGKLGLFNTSSWLVGSTVYSTNTYIWVRVVWNGASYKVYGLLDNSYTVDTLPSIDSWTLETTWTTTTNIWSQQLYLGNSNNTTSEYFNGTIDLNETYININGSRWWTGVDNLEYKKNPNGHIFYNITQKDQVDELFASTGSAWMYGIDTENERIFLPRDNFFAIKGIASVAGNGLTVGFTDGTNNAGLLNFGGGSVGHIGVGVNDYGIAVGAARGTASYLRSDVTIGLTTDPTKSGIEAHLTTNEDKYLYICVGNTVSDTSWVDVVTQVKGGVKDIEDKRVQALSDLHNKENAGLSALANASNALRTTQITNCITEIPQNIKLELADGLLILKAGSKVIVPNGFEANGTTPKFDEVVVGSDVISGSITTEGTTMLFSNSSGTAISYQAGAGDMLQYMYSGSTAPTVFYANKYAYWYDTASNLIKQTTDGGSTWYTGRTLPFCVVSYSSSGITSIDQVFNGFGYIGSTVWVDKGVKGLIPNGRNEDGSLNNVEFTTQNVLTNTYSSSNGSFVLRINNGKSVNATANVVYDEVKNLIYIQNTTYPSTIIGNVVYNNGKLTSFNPKQPFRAVDYNDKQEIISWLMPDYSAGIDISSRVLTGYTAPSDGFITFSYATASAFTITVNDNIVTQKIKTSGTYTITAQIFVKKGDVFRATLSDWYSYFFPLKGAK